jgi:hypothetical protein
MAMVAMAPRDGQCATMQTSGKHHGGRHDSNKHHSEKHHSGKHDSIVPQR